MNSKKEDFLNQLEFELGHRWSDSDMQSLTTLAELEKCIFKKSDKSKWHFLRFLPIYSQSKKWIEKQIGESVSTQFDLNTLKTSQKAELIRFLTEKFGKPLAMRRPVFIQKVIYTLPILLIIVPLLISTYLITAKDVTGWIYMSGIIGLLLTIGAFKITESTKKQFSPNTLLEYSKAFYVVNNQSISKNASREDLLDFLCAAAERFYKQPFTSSSEIPDK